MESRVEQLDKLVQALGPAVAQVARLDDAVDDLEKWIQDERLARRQYNAEIMDSMREVRAEFKSHREATDVAIGELRKEVRDLKLDQRNGRRTLIASMFGSVCLLLGGLASAVAIVVSQGT